MSTVTEVETALKELPLEEAQRVDRWLQKYLGQETAFNSASRASVPTRRTQSPPSNFATLRASASAPGSGGNLIPR